MPPDHWSRLLVALESLLLDHAWCELRRDPGFNAARREFRNAFVAVQGVEWYALAPTQERIEPHG